MQTLCAPLSNLETYVSFCVVCNYHFLRFLDLTNYSNFGFKKSYSFLSLINPCFYNGDKSSIPQLSIIIKFNQFYLLVDVWNRQKWSTVFCFILAISTTNIVRCIDMPTYPAWHKQVTSSKLWVSRNCLVNKQCWESQFVAYYELQNNIFLTIRHRTHFSAQQRYRTVLLRNSTGNSFLTGIDLNPRKDK